MAEWFDGTLTYTAEELTDEFPVQVSEDMLLYDSRRLAIVNHTEDGTFLNEFSEPDFNGKKPFYHVSFGQYAVAERRTISDFLSCGFQHEEKSISLFRQDPDRLYRYGYGLICEDLLEKQDELRQLLPADRQEKETFILPLKICLFACPVCGHHTLHDRKNFDICTECGWEDDGAVDEDAYTLANNDWTIRTYRRKYQLARRDPDYVWNFHKDAYWRHEINAIHIVKADITSLETDAIVNAANEGLYPGGGVCGAIFRAAGYDELNAACRSIGHCDTGSAVMTPGFGLKANYIIHAVGPVWQGGGNGEEKLLSGAYRSALELARQHGCRSVAFPLISAGIYGYPRNLAWTAAIKACQTFFRDHADADMQVTFAVLDEEIGREGLTLLNELAPEYLLE